MWWLLGYKKNSQKIESKNLERGAELYLSENNERIYTKASDDISEALGSESSITSEIERDDSEWVEIHQSYPLLSIESNYNKCVKGQPSLSDSSWTNKDKKSGNIPLPQAFFRTCKNSSTNLRDQGDSSIFKSDYNYLDYKNNSHSTPEHLAIHQISDNLAEIYSQDDLHFKESENVCPSNLIHPTEQDSTDNMNNFRHQSEINSTRKMFFPSQITLTSNNSDTSSKNDDYEYSIELINDKTYMNKTIHLEENILDTFQHLTIEKYDVPAKVIDLSSISLNLNSENRSSLSFSSRSVFSYSPKYISEASRKSNSYDYDEHSQYSMNKLPYLNKSESQSIHSCSKSYSLHKPDCSERSLRSKTSNTSFCKLCHQMNKELENLKVQNESLKKALKEASLNSKPSTSSLNSIQRIFAVVGEFLWNAFTSSSTEEKFTMSNYSYKNLPKNFYSVPDVETSIFDYFLGSVLQMNKLIEATHIPQTPQRNKSIFSSSYGAICPSSHSRRPSIKPLNLLLATFPVKKLETFRNVNQSKNYFNTDSEESSSDKFSQISENPTNDSETINSCTIYSSGDHSPITDEIKSKQMDENYENIEGILYVEDISNNTQSDEKCVPEFFKTSEIDETSSNELISVPEYVSNTTDMWAIVKQVMFPPNLKSSRISTANNRNIDRIKKDEDKARKKIDILNRGRLTCPIQGSACLLSSMMASLSQPANNINRNAFNIPLRSQIENMLIDYEAFLFTKLDSSTLVEPYVSTISAFPQFLTSICKRKKIILSTLAPHLQDEKPQIFRHDAIETACEITSSPPSSPILSSLKTSARPSSNLLSK